MSTAGEFSRFPGIDRSLVVLEGGDLTLHLPDNQSRQLTPASAPYAFDVEITGADRHGWLQLGEVDQRATTVFEAVLDQGSAWIVRLADGEGGEVRYTRDELVRAGWRV